MFAEIGELVNKSKSIPKDHGKKFFLFRSLGMLPHTRATSLFTTPCALTVHTAHSVVKLVVL